MTPEELQDKCEIIARDLRTPWSRKRLANAMCGLPYLPPSQFERPITPAYLMAKDAYEIASQRAYSLFLWVFVGIDNRSYDDIKKSYEDRERNGK